MRIDIKKPFREQYTVFIDSDLMAINAVMKGKTQLRWDFEVVSILPEETLEIRLLLLEQNILEANNPLVREVAAFTSTLASVYNELHLITDRKGKILKILNKDILVSKWKLIKNELVKIASHTPDIQNVVTINDNLFQDDGNLINSLQQSEFFLLYFNAIFGKLLPYSLSNYKMPNFLNTAVLPWDKKITFEGIDTATGNLKIEVKSTPDFPFFNSFKETAYGQFKDKIDLAKIVPQLSEEGKYLVEEKTGRVLLSEIKREEMVAPGQLYTKVKYTFMCAEAYSEYLAKQ